MAESRMNENRYADQDDAQQAACELSCEHPDQVWAVLEWAADSSRSGDTSNEFEVLSYAHRERCEGLGNLVAMYVAGEVL